MSRATDPREDPDAVAAAVGGAAEALRQRNRLLGLPLVVWRDGKVQCVDSLGAGIAIRGRLIGVLGSGFADEIFGDGGDNWIDGGEGDDLIDGRSGDDRLYGSDGDDTLIGGEGADLLIGGDDNDELRGDSGADELARMRPTARLTCLVLTKFKMPPSAISAARRSMPSLRAPR